MNAFASPARPPVEWPVQASEKAIGAWKNARARLSWRDSDARVLEGLEVVGERAGRLVLLDRSAETAWVAPNRARQIEALLAPLGYATFEVVGLGELKRCGAIA